MLIFAQGLLLLYIVVTVSSFFYAPFSFSMIYIFW
uniref:Uncharacterized protein n=1 Tax=Rhizophora mucronata TaxID=61149 RepID=A0A2P2N8B1_RHIMU